jgi:hypothetical protein
MPGRASSLPRCFSGWGITVGLISNRHPASCRNLADGMNAQIAKSTCQCYG